MGMRPLRKSAMWDAFQEQYGKPTAGGQLLAYFCLICILAVLAMVLARPGARRRRAGRRTRTAAGLIPFTALGVRDAGAVPDGQPERRAPEQAARSSSAA